jgi:pilus assembly protein CpaF
VSLSDRLAQFDDDASGENGRGDAAPPRAPSNAGAPPGFLEHGFDIANAAGFRSAAGRAGQTGASRDLEQRRKVRALVLEDVAPRMVGLTGEQLQAEVKAAVDRILQREDIDIPTVERRAFIDEVIADTLGYGALDPLLRDPSVSEIMCNAFDDIWIERNGRIEALDLTFADDEAYRQVIQKIVSAVGRRVDESSPMVDARLPDGSRVNAIIPPLALRGPVLTIRKFAEDPFTAEDLVSTGSYTEDLVTVLRAAVKGRLNILVSGGTGTGKTTNLNVLSSFVPESERIITIEDSAELQLQQRHTIPLESRPANAEGRGEVPIRELVRNALRMRPDRIIVGECRAAEALDMLQAMNTGHEGSMTTIHANTARDALSRLETMVLMAGYDLPVRAIREQIASAIDLVMQVERLPSGRRVVTSLTELQGMEGETILMQDVFALHFDEASPEGRLEAAGLRPKFVDELRRRHVEIPSSVFRRPGSLAAGVVPRGADRPTSPPPAAAVPPPPPEGGMR